MKRSTALQRRGAVLVGGWGSLSFVPLGSPRGLRTTDYITDGEGSRRRGLVAVDVVDVVDVVERERKLGTEGNKSNAW